MAITLTSAAALTALFILLLRGGDSQKFIDSDYLELALNLEYLETEFFLFGALGYGLDKVAPGLSQGGPQPVGAQKAYLSPGLKDIIEQFGYQEVGHLRAIKRQVRGFPRPLLDISVKSFSDIMDKAFNETLSPPFNPYAHDFNYLIASYVIPYVGLTGYVGAAPNLQTSTFKKLVAGLLGVESGQDAVIRALLYQFAHVKVWPYPYTVAEFTDKISTLRDSLGGDGVKDEGIIVDQSQGAEGRIAGNVLAGDAQSLSYDRTPQEILRIVYGTGDAAQPGGFFPRGAGGKFAKSYHY